MRKKLILGTFKHSSIIFLIWLREVNFKEILRITQSKYLIYNTHHQKVSIFKWTYMVFHNR